MTQPSAPRRSIVVFDLGGVLIDWNPRHLYRKLIADETDMEHFLATVCTQVTFMVEAFAKGLAHK